MKRWILLLLLSLCAQPACFAATHTHANTAQKSAKHSTAGKTGAHKTKHKKTSKVSGKKSSNAYANKNNFAAASVAVPQAKFDLDFSANKENVAAFNQNTYSNDPLDTSSKNLTALAYQTVESARFSQYKFGGNIFDRVKGIYKIDCSAFINGLLSQANPEAFSNLVRNTQTAKPTTRDYYHFFQQLPQQKTQYWHKIVNIEQLGPGGILVFLNRAFRSNRLGGGHVMVVMSKPIQHNFDTYQIQVADSASSGHSFDTRLPHKSGIGIGTLLLKVDPYTKQPKAYAWRMDDHWRSNISFAMAKPLWSHFD